MIERTLKRYPIRRVVLIADRGLLSLGNLAQIEALKTANGEPLEYILAVPGRRYGEFADLIAATPLTEGLAESVWQERRRPVRCPERQRTRRRYQSVVTFLAPRQGRSTTYVISCGTSGVYHRSMQT
ncbi:MAG: hypothetical protein ACREPS_00270 [Rhodanobacteraceae bacterium]